MHLRKFNIAQKMRYVQQIFEKTASIIIEMKESTFENENGPKFTRNTFDFLGRFTIIGRVIVL